MKISKKKIMPILRDVFENTPLLDSTDVVCKKCPVNLANTLDDCDNCDFAKKILDYLRKDNKKPKKSKKSSDELFALKQKASIHNELYLMYKDLYHTAAKALIKKEKVIADFIKNYQQ